MEFTIPIPNEQLTWFDSLDETTVDMALKSYDKEINAISSTQNAYLAFIRREINNHPWLRIRDRTERTVRILDDRAKWLTNTCRLIDPVNDLYVDDIAKAIVLVALSRLRP